MQPEDIGYYHLRIGHGITLAYTYTTEGFVQFSYAICSKNDQYNKKTGREIAARRLAHRKQHKVSGFKKPMGPQGKRFPILKKIVSTFLYDVAKNKEYISASSWLRKLVKKKGVVGYTGEEIEGILSLLFPVQFERKTA